ncbi:MAG: hypothetical protein M1820_008205 [Bogoriella megaspora]|nr:MAG: hypothetical protein M1820_008205 [Bogoriella megaspora]
MSIFDDHAYEDYVLDLCKNYPGNADHFHKYLETHGEENPMKLTKSFKVIACRLISCPSFFPTAEVYDGAVRFLRCHSMESLLAFLVKMFPQEPFTANYVEQEYTTLEESIFEFIQKHCTPGEKPSEQFRRSYGDNPPNLWTKSSPPPQMKKLFAETPHYTDEEIDESLEARRAKVLAESGPLTGWDDSSDGEEEDIWDSDNEWVQDIDGDSVGDGKDEDNGEDDSPLTTPEMSDEDTAVRDASNKVDRGEDCRNSYEENDEQNGGSGSEGNLADDTHHVVPENLTPSRKRSRSPSLDSDADGEEARPSERVKKIEILENSADVTSIPRSKIHAG